MRAYKVMYIAHAADMFGSMMDFAVNDCGFGGDDFLHMFVVSGLAEQFERGNPKYIAGKSGAELVSEVMLATIMTSTADTWQLPKPCRRDCRTPEYWAGWVLAQYQWATAKTFASILRALPFDGIARMYPTLHEADITKFFSVADNICAQESPQTNLKRIRAAAGVSQTGLAKESGVSLRSIQMYEQRKKDINKAQAITLVKLARALGYTAEDLIEPMRA